MLSVTVKRNAFEVSPSLPATVLETFRLPVAGSGSDSGVWVLVMVQPVVSYQVMEVSYPSTSTSSMI